MEQIHEIIDEINQRKVKDYQKMSVAEISIELHGAMQFEQNTFQRIELLENKGISPDITRYAKMICRNATEREVSEIQDVYLAKIDAEYLGNSRW